VVRRLVRRVVRVLVGDSGSDFGFVSTGEVREDTESPEDPDGVGFGFRGV
jgi:hypothetical protein